MIFMTDSFKDYDITHNTIISIAKMINANYIRSVINNTVYFINPVSYAPNIAIDQRVAHIIYEHIKNKDYEIWI